MYTLLVVDMQDTFKAANVLRVINACQREIRLAIKKKADIVFVEFEHCGHTLSDLTNITVDYNKHYYVTKPIDDGSYDIMKLVRKKDLHRNFRIVGVNTSYCIYETALGLMNYSRNITVVADACNCHNHEFGINKLKELKIKIINSCNDNKNKVDVAYPVW